MAWRRDHLYGVETYEAKRLRLRANSEDPRPGLDHEHDRTDDFDPATDRWPSTCHALPGTLSLAGSRGTDAAHRSPHPAGAADTRVAGGPGSARPPATRTNGGRAA